MVGQKTRGDEYLEIEQRKIELEEQLLDLQERRIDIEQKRIELELRKVKLLSRKSKKKSKRLPQSARDDSPYGARSTGGGRIDSEDDDDDDCDYERSTGGGGEGKTTTPDDDDEYEYEEEDDVEEDEVPTKGVVKEKRSRNRSFRRGSSDKLAVSQGDTLSSTTGSSHSKGRGTRRSSSRSKQRVPDSEFSPLPPIGRATSRSIKMSESASIDGGDDIEGSPSSALPPTLPFIMKNKSRKQEPESKGSGRRMSRRGSEPTGTVIDTLPEERVAGRRDFMTKHNSLRNFGVAQAKKDGGGRYAFRVESLSTVEANHNESDASMDGLSVMTEKHSNKTQERRTSPVVTPSFTNSPAQALWK